MSTGLRAGTNNDGYLQVNGTDILTVSSGVLGVIDKASDRTIEDALPPIPEE